MFFLRCECCEDCVCGGWGGGFGFLHLSYALLLGRYVGFPGRKRSWIFSITLGVVWFGLVFLGGGGIEMGMGICEVGWMDGFWGAVFWFLTFESRGVCGVWRGSIWEKGEGFKGWGDEKWRGDQRE